MQTTVKENTYSYAEIAYLLNKPIKKVYNISFKLKLVPVKIVSGKHFYSTSQVMKIKDNYEKLIEIKYYPLKTTEVYYIYQSKMNNIE